MKHVIMVVALLATGCNLTGLLEQDTGLLEEEFEEPPSFLDEVFADFVEDHPTQTYIADYVEELSGSVDQLGGVHTDIYPGDNAADNAGYEGFITFDISTLPENVIIIENAVLSFECETNGFPFADAPFGLGVLRIEAFDYGELNSGDYVGGSIGEHVYDLNACPVIPIDVTNVVISKIGQQYLQLRLYFLDSNEDFYRDDVVIKSPVLVINYVSS